MACTERQFTLYFESSEDDICKSLCSDIHNEKVVSSTLNNLLLDGFQVKMIFLTDYQFYINC